MVTQSMLRTLEDRQVCSGEKSKFVPAHALIKCLKQVKLSDFHTCEPISETPSNISTIVDILEFPQNFTGIDNGFPMQKHHSPFSRWLVKLPCARVQFDFFNAVY